MRLSIPSNLQYLFITLQQTAIASLKKLHLPGLFDSVSAKPDFKSTIITLQRKKEKKKSNHFVLRSACCNFAF
jgi:hypothetical protein